MSNTDIDAVFELIDRQVRQAMAARDTPGLSLAVTDRAGLLRIACYGYADLEARRPVRPGDLFEFGSIGKSFTAILLLQLAEAGRVDLHAPLSEYLPWFEIQSEHEPFTLHHLLSHTAGIIRGDEFPTDPRYEVWAMRDTRASSPPGELFHYSNVGYKALGLVLERLTGQPYEALVRERILEPLGMTATEPVITHRMRERLARGYAGRFDDRPWRLEHGHVPATWLETDSADGCLAGAPADLAAYLRMLMNAGAGPAGRIMSEDSFRLMTTPHTPQEDGGLSEGESYGYGLYLRHEGERLARLNHAGGMVGYTSLMAADLESGYGVVTMVNGNCDQDAIIDFALEALVAFSRDDELPDVPPQPARFAVTDPAGFTGSFSSEEGELTVEQDGDGLRLRFDDQTANLEPRGRGGFVVHHQRFDRFLLRPVRDEDARLTAWTHGPRVWRASGSEETDVQAPESWHAYAGHYRNHNPWFGNFRVVLREGALWLVYPSGQEAKLIPREDGSFTVGREHLPETIRFDTIVDGEAWRANLDGTDFYRFFTA